VGADEKEILERTATFLAAWQRRDAKAATAHMTEDAVRVGAFGDVQRGRAEIKTAFQKLFSGGPMKGAKIQFEPSVRLLASEVAVSQGALTITPAEGAPMAGYVVELWKKRDGRWCLIETHPKFSPLSVSGALSADCRATVTCARLLRAREREAPRKALFWHLACTYGARHEQGGAEVRRLVGRRHREDPQGRGQGEGAPRRR
jgi:uncharacterized protein (TIGR02246 family)